MVQLGEEGREAWQWRGRLGRRFWNAHLRCLDPCLGYPTPHPLAGVEDRGLVFQAEGPSTSVMDAIRNVFLRPVDGETKARPPPAPAVGKTPAVGEPRPP